MSRPTAATAAGRRHRSRPWSSSLVSACRCWANRVLPGPERLADVFLRVLQESLGAAQRAPAAVEHLSGLLLYRPQALGRPGPHAPRLALHIALDVPPPEPRHDGARDRSQNECLTVSHCDPPRLMVVCPACPAAAPSGLPFPAPASAGPHTARRRRVSARACRSSRSSRRTRHE